jgi:CRISP-associated protein Cas1
MSNLTLHQQKQIFTIITNPITEDKLSLTNANLVFETAGIKKAKIPISKILLLIIVGDMRISTKLLYQLSQSQIDIIMLKSNFLPYIDFTRPKEYGDRELKLAQYQSYVDSATQLKIANHIIHNKINNQLHILKKARIIKPSKLPTTLIFGNVDQIMGYEGSYSATYFSLLFEKHNWTRRIPRAKEDINNFLLDIGYTYLFNMVSGLCSKIGYENNFGFLHADYYQRQSLVCDLMEPMRPIIDYILYKAYNLGQIKKEHFETIEGKTRIKDYKNIGIYTDLFVKVMIEHQDSIYKYLLAFADSLKNEGKPLAIFEL